MLGRWKHLFAKKLSRDERLMISGTLWHWHTANEGMDSYR